MRTDKYIITVTHKGKFDPVLLGDMIAARAWSMDGVEDAESQRIPDYVNDPAVSYKSTRTPPKQTSEDILLEERSRVSKAAQWIGRWWRFGCGR
jgi:hypothetical protein